MREKKYMIVHFPYKKGLINRLDTVLSLCCMPHTIFDKHDYYAVWVNKGKYCTWKDVDKEIDRVFHAERHFLSV